MPFRSRRAVLGASLLLTALVTAGCSADGAGTADASGGTPTPTPSEASPTPSAEVLAERDAFIAAQGQSQDGSLPTAKTSEQQAFLSQEKTYIESQGGTWDAFYDGVALAMTLDACETSILNRHDVTPDIARLHIDSSPLMQSISEGDAAAIEGLASIMVSGTSFLCPDDAAQWEAGFAEIYG
ncbi:hypothetical protein ACIQLJ_06025 [Microbacterium sp. NPDC091313]